MTKHVINSLDEAIEAAGHYSELGLHVPLDVLTYLEANGIQFEGCDFTAEYQLQEMNNG